MHFSVFSNPPTTVVKDSRRIKNSVYSVSAYNRHENRQPVYQVFHPRKGGSKYAINTLTQSNNNDGTDHRCR